MHFPVFVSLLYMTSMVRKMVLYGASGIVAITVHYLTLLLGVEAFTLEPAVCSGAGFLFGAAVQYVFNYSLTFSSTISHQRAIPRYIINLLLSFTLNVGLMFVLVNKLHIYYLLAQLGVTVSLFIFNYVLSANWVYDDCERESRS